MGFGFQYRYEYPFDVTVTVSFHNRMWYPAKFSLLTRTSPILRSLYVWGFHKISFGFDIIEKIHPRKNQFFSSLALPSMAACCYKFTTVICKEVYDEIKCLYFAIYGLMLQADLLTSVVKLHPTWALTNLELFWAWSQPTGCTKLSKCLLKLFIQSRWWRECSPTLTDNNSILPVTTKIIYLTLLAAIKLIFRKHDTKMLLHIIIAFITFAYFIDSMELTIPLGNGEFEDVLNNLMPAPRRLFYT